MQEITFVFDVKERLIINQDMDCLAKESPIASLITSALIDALIITTRYYALFPVLAFLGFRFLILTPLSWLYMILDNDWLSPIFWPWFDSAPRRRDICYYIFFPLAGRAS